MAGRAPSSPHGPPLSPCSPGELQSFRKAGFVGSLSRMDVAEKPARPAFRPPPCACAGASEQEGTPGRMACASTTRVTAPGPHPRLTPAWGRQPPPSGLPDHRRQDWPGLRAREGGQDGPDGVRPIQQASEHDERPACVKWQPSRRRVPALEGCTPDGGRGWPVPTAHGPWSTTPWRGGGQEQPRPGAEGCGQGSWGWGWERSLATSAQPPWMSGDTRRE